MTAGRSSNMKSTDQKRVSLAKQLLIQRKISLSDVATQSGFADQSAMTRTFVNCVGVSPGRWRREQLGTPGVFRHLLQMERLRSNSDPIMRNRVRK
jgi:AraC-like DNA-binding protein